MDTMEETTPTPIQNFYSGCNVFITGGTGFMGKILIEKLLRSFPDIGNLYLLIRSKKGKLVHERLDDLFDDVVFERLNTECPKFRHKIVGIVGDCSLPELGIGEKDKKLLCDEISVVFHVAATVRFDEKLSLATKINIRSTKDLLKMCSEMGKLKSFVHVSTAYSNCAQRVIEEIFYPVPIEYQKLILMAENLNDEILEIITPNLMKNFPNTYALTKAVAEQVVQEEGKNLPVGLFRPSIVISSYKEPVTGWVDNMYGPTGVSCGAAAGIFRTLHCDSQVNANIVPVDMCISALIAVAWETDYLHQKAKQEGATSDIPIFQYESSIDNPINWTSFMAYTKKFGINYPPYNAIWYYGFVMYKNKTLYLLSQIYHHYLPALFVDFTMICMGKKPRMLKIYKKIHKFSNVISYFSTQNFVFESTRMRGLISRMSHQDQNTFFCDLKKLEWEEYFKTYIMGIRLYLMKDPLSTIEAAKKKWRRLHWLHNGCQVLIFFILFKILWFFLSIVFSTITKS